VRQTIKVLFIFSFTIFASPILSAQGDEVDEIVEVLNEELRKGDHSGFAKKFMNSARNDRRFEGVDYNALEKKTVVVLGSADVFGEYISDTIVRKEYCGNRIARVISTFFGNEGQYVIEYWFFKTEEKWGATSFDLHGASNTGDFLNKLKKILAVSC